MAMTREQLLRLRAQPRWVWVRFPANPVSQANRELWERGIRGSYKRHLSRKFAADLRAAGLVWQFNTLTRDILRQGLQLCQISYAEYIFRRHRALLVEFNNYLPQGYTCSVPPEEVN